MEEIKLEKTGKEKSSIYFIITACFSFILPLIIYALTTCPTLYTEDNGEFIAGAYTCGVLHPPGYPLYSIVGKVFSYIPLGSIAWRINFMSGFWAALAGLFLFLLIYRITRKTEISFVSAMLFCFSPDLWSQSVVAEVYTLNIFFLSVCLYLLCLWRDTDKNKYLYIFSFMYGLSLTNHHFMTLAGPFFLIFIIWTKWRVLKDLKLVLGCVGLFIVGLLPYLYLPIASKFNPALDWGNPETFKRFMLHIQRRMYNDVDIGRYGIDVKLQFIKQFLIQLKEQFWIPVVVIGVIGSLRSFIKDVKYAVLLLGIFIFNSIFLIIIQEHPYSIMRAEVMSVYYFPCYLIFACYIGYGLSYLWDISLKFFKNSSLWKWVLTIAILLLAVMQIGVNYYKNDLSRNYYVYDFLKSHMDLLERDAIVFVKGDHLAFGILYMQQVEEYRKDVKMYEFIGALSDEYLGEDFLFGTFTKEERENVRRKVYTEIIDENYGKRPIYFLYDFYLGPDSKYELVPFGLIFRVQKKGDKIEPSFDPLSKIKLHNLGDGVYKDFDIEKILSSYWDMLAIYYANQGNIEKTRECYDEVYKYKGANALANAGGFFLKIGDFDMAFKCFNKSIRLDPDYPLSYYNMAIGYDITDNKKEALKNYITFLTKTEGELLYTKSTKFAEKRIKILKKDLGIKDFK
ncbi:MAG: DUF2723 domain-containing protein [Armatimonadota bacterium]